MTPNEPLPLHHSWPLTDIATQFDLGRVHDDAALPVPGGPGYWTCNLADDALHWSPVVYGLFGLPAGQAATRSASLALYDEGSRAAMERLRAHAIRHRRGFTVDIRVHPMGVRTARWVRLTAAPVCEDQRVIGLRGCKTDVTGLYARG